jgi:septal ring factor EnvC (AmiA/AmiB activator)
VDVALLLRSCYIITTLLVGSALVAGATVTRESADPEIVAAIDARLAVLGKTADLLDNKYSAHARETHSRVRSLYKIARAGFAPLWVDADERGATLRRRAAARRILRRDLRELALLHDEIEVAEAARVRLEGERRQVDAIRPPPGSLARPVAGSIAAGFGTYRHRASRARLSRRGLELRARRGAAVVAVADGTVRYAGPVRGLDIAVVIEHDGFLSVIGRLTDPSVAAGERVVRGQRLAAAQRRRVYVEVRLAVGASGYPIDPQPLFE